MDGSPGQLGTFFGNRTEDVMGAAQEGASAVNLSVGCGTGDLCWCEWRACDRGSGQRVSP